jgi:hypothetical protein
MVFAGGDDNMIGKNLINQTMFLCNMPGPISRPVPFKRFRLAGSVKKVSGYFSNESIYFSMIFLSSLAQLQ